MVVDLGKRVNDEVENIREYMGDIEDKRADVENARLSGRAPKEKDVSNLISLETICARKAIGLAESLGNDQEEAIRLRGYATFLLSDIGREALYAGNQMIAAKYLREASDLAYENTQLEASRNQSVQERHRGRRGIENEDEEEERQYFRGPHGTYHSLSAIMVAVGMIVLLVGGMPRLTGGAIGIGAVGYIDMIGVFLTLAGIALMFVKRK